MHHHHLSLGLAGLITLGLTVGVAYELYRHARERRRLGTHRRRRLL